MDTIGLKIQKMTLLEESILAVSSKRLNKKPARNIID